MAKAEIWEDWVYQYDPSLTVETMYSIFKELFPDRNVYYRKTLVEGKTACVEINKLNSINCICSPSEDFSTIKVLCVPANTIKGRLLLGGVVASFFRGGCDEMMEQIFDELERRFVRIKQ